MDEVTRNCTREANLAYLPLSALQDLKDVILVSGNQRCTDTHAFVCCFFSQRRMSSPSESQGGAAPGRRQAQSSAPCPGQHWTPESPAREPRKAQRSLALAVHPAPRPAMLLLLALLPAFGGLQARLGKTQGDSTSFPSFALWAALGSSWGVVSCGSGTQSAPFGTPCWCRPPGLPPAPLLEQRRMMLAKASNLRIEGPGLSSRGSF